MNELLDLDLLVLEAEFFGLCHVEFVLEFEERIDFLLERRHPIADFTLRDLQLGHNTEKKDENGSIFNVYKISKSRAMSWEVNRQN